jgi:hypothetical protein
MAEIYLDSNVYLSIAKREQFYEYTIAKINNLYKSGFIFPHSPAHGEEISARILEGRDIELACRVVNLISRYNGKKGYFPGCPNIEETEEMIAEMERCVEAHPELRSAISIHKKNLSEMRSGNFNKLRFRTGILNDGIDDCIFRVVKHLGLTDVATRTDLFHLGRRREETLKKNFSELQISPDGVETFEKLRKKYKLETRRLANIGPDKLFTDERFLNFIRDQLLENGFDFDKVPKGGVLSHSHHKKEGLITVILNSMEKAGYWQEDKNHVATLVGRMHDVTHAIYATGAKYFITSDSRFAKKVTATYLFLEIPTRVISTRQFVEESFVVA